ncbi:MAG: hypothetical protein ACRC68_02685, partial [Clostridium sp.]
SIIKKLDTEYNEGKNIDLVNNIDENMAVEFSDGLFKSKEAEIIFYLLEIDGSKVSVKKLTPR